MSYGIRMVAEALRRVAFGGIGAGYAVLGTPLEHPTRILIIKNLTNENLVFSYDGITDHEIIPKLSGQVLDLTTNKATPEGAFFGQGTQVWVKHDGVAPTSGLVAASVYFCLGD